MVLGRVIHSVSWAGPFAIGEGFDNSVCIKVIAVLVVVIYAVAGVVVACINTESGVTAITGIKPIEETGILLMLNWSLEEVTVSGELVKVEQIVSIFYRTIVCPGIGIWVVRALRSSVSLIIELEIGSILLEISNVGEVIIAEDLVKVKRGRGHVSIFLPYSGNITSRTERL